MKTLQQLEALSIRLEPGVKTELDDKVHVGGWLFIWARRKFIAIRHHPSIGYTFTFASDDDQKDDEVVHVTNVVAAGRLLRKRMGTRATARRTRPVAAAAR